MKKSVKMCLFLIVFSPLTIASSPDVKGWSGWTGNDLLPICSVVVDLMDKKEINNAQMDDANKCMKYVSGYADGFSFGQTAGREGCSRKGESMVCIPEDVNTGQIIRVVVKWLRDHPEKLNEAAPICMFNAFFDAFKCKHSN